MMQPRYFEKGLEGCSNETHHADILDKLSDEAWVEAEISRLGEEPLPPVTEQQLRIRGAQTTPLRLSVRCCELLIEYPKHAKLWNAVAALCEKEFHTLGNYPFF